MIASSRACAKLAMNHVSFCDRSGHNVLQGITMRIGLGERLAVGLDSDTARIALLGILSGRMAPTDGSVLLDGQDLVEFPGNEISHRVAFVSDRPPVFEGTVRENLALAKTGASLAEIGDAAAVAGLDEFIGTLSRQFDTVIEDDIESLSPSFRVRLSLARAALRGVDIIVCDEPADEQAARALQEALPNLPLTTSVLIVRRMESASRRSRVPERAAA